MKPEVFASLGKLPAFVGKAVYKERTSLCEKCDHKKLLVCTKCGCPIHTKAALKNSSCPVGKWSSDLRAIEIENAGANFVGGWFMDDPSICDGVIDLFDQHPNKIRGLAGVNPRESGVNTEVKDSWDLSLPWWDKDPRWVRYMEALSAAKNKYVSAFPWCDQMGKWAIVENINVQYYPPTGGFKKWHTERTSSRFPNVMRHVVFMTYLNDVIDDADEFAGGTEFFHQELKLKARKGLTVFWPSDWTHVHRGIVSQSHAKYIVTGWYSFDD